MTKLTRGLALVAALLTGGLFAVPALADGRSAKHPGTLHVFDEAKLFTADGIKRAESHLSSMSFDHGLTVTVDTHPSLPPERKPEFEKAKDNAEKRAVFEAWAKSLYTGDKARGIYIFINRSPGAVVVLTDKESHNRGFSKENEGKLQRMLQTGLHDAAAKPAADQMAANDAALLKAVDYVIEDLKGTKVTTTADGKPLDTKQASTKKAGGMSIGGWVCLGLCVLLGVWLVIGLIRAFTGGGGGYGPGGGGGGGGFGTSLLGGLFGAMAGMWLYNNLFGGHSFGSSDAFAGDSGTGGDYGDGGDTGAGELADDTGSSGYDDGDFGGGDAGGGDFGGDFGGGGGDFGGDF